MKALARLLLLALSLALAIGARAAYPERTIRIIVPFQAGGAGDTAARVLAEGLARRLGQPVIVDNRPGATGTIGAREAAEAAPDGYTLLLGHSDTLVLAPLTHKRLRYDPQRDFEPVAFVSRVPGALIARRGSGVDSGAALIAAARAHPGEVTMASWGVGSSPHLGMELMDQVAGIRLLHVPYPSTPAAINALLSGQVDLAWVTPEFALQVARQGKALIVGGSSASRLSRAPTIRPLAEQGFPGLDLDTWYALMLPAGAPGAVQARLHDLVNELLADPVINRRLREGGHEPQPMSIEAFKGFWEADRRRWASLIKSSNLRLELN